MKAAILRQANTDLVVEDVDIDDPLDEEVLIRVAATGLCHSDMRYLTGEQPLLGPTIVGHEVAGVVEAVGARVTTVRPGDTVVACASGSCAHCESCITGRTHLCTSLPGRASTSPARITQAGQPVIQGTRVGGFAEKVLLHESFIVAIPSDVPLDRAAVLGCSVLTGLGSVFNSAKVVPGSSVVVLGCGGVGLNIIQGARIAGASQIIAVDVAASKKELALRFGATDFVTGGEDAVANVLEVSRGGVEYAFEAIGLPVTIEQAVHMLRTSGLLTLVGVTAPLGTAAVPVFRAVTKELRVQGALMGSAPMKRDIPRFAKMYLDGKVDLDGLISNRIPLSEINAGFAAMEKGSVARSLVVFD